MLSAEETEPVLVGGIAVTDLATTFGTPLYVYDAELILRRYQLLVDGIGYQPLGVFYSCKANAAIGILRLLNGLGVRIDACSPGDLFAAQRAGCDTGISYVGVAASAADLDAVVDAGAFFIADSLAQIDGYADRIGSGGEIGLRINCAVTPEVKRIVSAGAWDAKFGIHLRTVPEALSRIARRGLRLAGLHTHIGSDIMEEAPYLEALRVLLGLAEEMRGVRFVSLGGGMGVAAGDLPDFPMAEFGAQARALLGEFERRTARRIELRVEPGGYLVMDSGVLLTTVTDVKRPVRVGDRVTPTFVCVDSSYNHVVSAVFHGTNHPIELGRDRAAETSAVVTIAGNLMQAGDIIAHDRPLPEIVIGDVLVVRRCGGYTSSRSTTFNERPRPAEVMVQDGHASLIRRAESVADLFLRDL